MTRQERIRLAEERLHSDNNVCHEPYGNKQRQPDGDHEINSSEARIIVH